MFFWAAVLFGTVPLGSSREVGWDRLSSEASMMFGGQYKAPYLL